jgi:hypothetical protein
MTTTTPRTDKAEAVIRDTDALGQADTADFVRQVARADGTALTDEQLEAISDRVWDWCCSEGPDDRALAIRILDEIDALTDPA